MAMLRTENFDAPIFISRGLQNHLYNETVEGHHWNKIFEWPTALVEMYYAAIENYREGARNSENLFTSEEVGFLRSIGCTTRELYDFVEDWFIFGEPSLDVVGRITAVRRQYFLSEQNSQPSTKVIPFSSLPPKEAKLGNFAWLPRITAKARAKLRGEMHPEVMYGCAADRSFLKRVGVDPAEFLSIVWDAGDDDQKILDLISLKAT